VVAKKKQEIQSLINKKNLLQSLCQSLLDKNCELYMKHEQMLEEERQERLRLAANFNEQMKEVQVELDAQKAKRQAEINENSELRTQIQKAIDEYRVKESSYREKMDAHQKVILDIEKKLKATIEGTVTKTIKEADAEKTKFMSVCDRVKGLSDKINDYMKKFDLIKEEMSDNSRRFETYQAQVETKKLEIRALEAEIENIQLIEKRHAKVNEEVGEDRKRVGTQVEALRNLAKALREQVKNLEASVK
jgi:chromosome segregation ATPase